MERTVPARAVTEVFEWLSALVSRQKVKGKPLKSVRDLNYARERERASERARRWLARGRKEDGKPSLPRVGEDVPLAPVNEKTVDGGGGKGDTSRRKTGEFMEISPSETVMHVSLISVAERLLATFCPRDNSPSFFMACPISQLKNYGRYALKRGGHDERWSSTDTKSGICGATVRRHGRKIVRKCALMRQLILVS